MKTNNLEALKASLSKGAIAYFIVYPNGEFAIFKAKWVDVDEIESWIKYNCMVTPLYDPQLEGIQPISELCNCWHCQPNQNFFVVCQKCGNKRCPKANWHIYECTRSNEPGQPGSRYEHLQSIKDSEDTINLLGSCAESAYTMALSTTPESVENRNKIEHQNKWKHWLDNFNSVLDKIKSDGPGAALNNEYVIKRANDALAMAREKE